MSLTWTSRLTSPCGERRCSTRSTSSSPAWASHFSPSWSSICRRTAARRRAGGRCRMVRRSVNFMFCHFISAYASVWQCAPAFFLLVFSDQLSGTWCDFSQRLLFKLAAAIIFNVILNLAFTLPDVQCVSLKWIQPASWFMNSKNESCNIARRTFALRNCFQLAAISRTWLAEPFSSLGQPTRPPVWVEFSVWVIEF